MRMNKNIFWNWKKENILNEKNPDRVLEIYGPIAEESWFDDEVTPRMFREELFHEDGDIILWINSPGGDCIAAAQIFNMLREYPGKVTVKIDGIAASAASVIAMAGDEILISPVAMMMIHNPATFSFGDHEQMKKTIEMLNETKESIMNAYEMKTGLSRSLLGQMMDEETWMDANKAVELGFADSIIQKNKESTPVEEQHTMSRLFSQKKLQQSLVNKIEKYKSNQHNPKENQVTVASLKERLALIKKFI